MATILKGTTFNTWVTAGGMHTMVESATISDIDRASIRSSEISLASAQAAALTNPADKEVWQITPSNGLATYDLANTRYRGCVPQIVVFTLSASSAAVEAGHGLSSISTDMTGIWTLTLAALSTSYVFAVALHTVAPGGKGVAVVAGPCKVKTTGTVNAGEGVKLSSTAGVFQSTGAVGTAIGRDCMGIAHVGSSGGMAWISLRR